MSRLLASLSTLALLLVAALVCGEILARSLFSYSLVGVADISGLVVAVAITAAFPLASAKRTHLVIELFKSQLGFGASALLTYLGGWLLLVALILVAWRFGLAAQEFGHRGAATQVIFVPISPFQWAITGFLTLAALLQLIALIKDGVTLLDQMRQRRTQTSAAKPAPDIAGRLSFILSIVFGILVIGFIGLAVLGRDWSLVWLLPESPLLVALIFFVLMWIAGLLLFPLWAVMLLIGFAGISVILDTEPALNLIATRTFDLLASDVLLIIPLFLLMGTFAQTAGLSTDMFRLANAILGHLRGGLALATIGACAGFGAMTGSSIATALTIGQAAYPEMRRFGYSDTLATGSIAAGGTLGQLVPPSAVLVLYAILTETSVGTLFIAAAIPAALIILLFILAVSIQVRINPDSAPAANPRQAGELIAALKAIWPSAGLIIVVLGGIYTGVFTVTEAASVGALGAFLLAWLRGRLGGGVLSRVMIETAERTSMIYALIIGGSIFAFFIGVTRLPVEATNLLAGFNLPGIVVVILALIIYIFLGMVMEAFAIMIITVPVIAPILEGFGFDLIWWGIIMVMVVEIGLLTPPFGMNCFIIKAIAADVPLGRVFRGVTPFVLADLLGLALLVAVPSIVLWLPDLLR